MAEIRRPRTAFLIFHQNVKNKVIINYPNATFGEIGMIIGDMWHHMTEEEKAPFIEMSSRDKMTWQRLRELDIRCHGATMTSRS